MYKRQFSESAIALDEGAEMGGGRAGWQPKALVIAVLSPINQEGVILTARGSTVRQFTHTGSEA